MPGYKSFLIIVGAAPCVQDDLAAIQGHNRFDFMLIGAAAQVAPHIKQLAYHVSHENDFPETRAVRKAARLNTDYTTWSNRPHEGITNFCPELTPPTCAYECRPRFGSKDPRNHHHYSGTSALLGLKIGLRLDYRKIVLAGVPIDSGHYAHFQVGWNWVGDLLRRCPVRSMSGFTMELLGNYTEEWLNG